MELAECDFPKLFSGINVMSSVDSIKESVHTFTDGIGFSGLILATPDSKVLLIDQKLRKSRRIKC